MSYMSKLVVAELGVERTVDVGQCDGRARTPQPVASALGPTFYWQVTRPAAESWADCEQLARALRGEPVDLPPAARGAVRPNAAGRDKADLGPLFSGGVDR